MASEKVKESVEIKTHKIPGPRDFWKKWRRGKPREVVSNPQDIPANKWLDPVKPPEIHAQERRERQLEAGVGTHASRTAAGMNRIEEEAEKVGEEETKRRARDLSSGGRKTSES